MRTQFSLLLTVLWLSVAGCGGDSSTGPSTPTYESIGGTYAGAMVGLSQGIALNATFSLTIAQTAGTTSGSWGLSGTLSDGFSSVNVAGTGTLTGAVAAGNNPSVNITIRTPACPNYSAGFSGAYDSANRRLTITGPVEFLNNTCNVVLTYPTTIILNR